VRTRDSINTGHERAVADQLLAALELEATFVRQGDPSKREPDVICCKPDGQTIGIEVVTAYYEDSDAQDAAGSLLPAMPLDPGLAFGLGKTWWSSATNSPLSTQRLPEEKK
jgi:hypothetical protein